MEALPLLMGLLLLGYPLSVSKLKWTRPSRWPPLPPCMYSVLLYLVFSYLIDQDRSLFIILYIKLDRVGK
jgi:hypothetical protein